MRDFENIADEDWQIVVDKYDLNSVMICRPDESRRGVFIGPMAVINVGCTIETDEGDEVLDLSGEDGRTLFSIACLPHVAGLFRWIKKRYTELGVAESEEYNRFVDELMVRVD